MVPIRLLSTAAILGLLVAACASISSTGVVPIGNDTYMVSATGPRGTESDMRAVAFKEASAHCVALKKELFPISVKGNRHVSFVRNAEAEVQFRCLAADDPALKRPAP